MLFEVTTRNGPLSVRNGPGRQFRLVTVLQKGAIVNVQKKAELNPGDVWLRVERGWASSRYLTPVSTERSTRRGHTRTQPLPQFLSFNPRVSALENRIESLTQRIERAENLAYVNGQMAADEGSRLYEMDSDTERAKRLGEVIDNIAILFGGAGGAPELPGAQRSGRWSRMREFERNAARYQNEARALEAELRQIEQELETLR